MRAPHFALFTLLLLVILLQPTNTKSRYFFNKASDYTDFFKTQLVRAKVETLGDIFKRHVQQLRHTPHKKVELIFLIDSSGTVGKYYFYEEIRFVRNLLADFTVDINTTRVSVITFSSPNKIFRYIDYLSHPDEDNHKCRLLLEDMPHVEYTPGGTHTLGAFLEAEKVLRSARPDAAKAIFLMTDGFSNGGDPRPVAQRLKREGVKIFTFGIKDGFVWELQEMASEPKNETCYILESFEEFEALAKRALHADLHNGGYIEQSMNKCQKLCNSEGLCCNENAVCSCGTYTGRYECMCRQGFYGTGRGKVGCLPCPAGTYKNFTGLGDVSTCTPCPDEHHTTPLAAVSISQCTCKKGYHISDTKECIVFRCSDLSPPKHGHFVNNKCNNVYNAACGLRCQMGYELRGSSLRICQDDGKWSGQETECVLRTCSAIPQPKNGHMVCSTDDFSYSTVCRFTCNAGYQLVGSRKRNCLAIAMWTGIATRCREITCPPLVEIKDGTFKPASCISQEMIFGSTCVISCSSGYTLVGPHTKQCTPDGTWLATENGVNQCIDETAPVLRCPQNIVVEADKLEPLTEVTWMVPIPVDNSGFRPLLTAEPAVQSGSKFPIGNTVVTYKAEDQSQNVARCKFTISVVDKTPPRIEKCISPPPFVSKSERTHLTIEPPVFSDNSGLPVEIAPSFRSGHQFPLGTTDVTFTAFDSANNNVTCSMQIMVVRHLCIIPEAPKHGNISCVEGNTQVVCKIACHEGFAFAVVPAREYVCQLDVGRWTPEEKFPDCAVVQISNEISQPALLTLTGDLSCKDRLLIERIEENLKDIMTEKISSACENELVCSVGALKSVCEDEEDFNKIQLVHDNKRRRRSLREYASKLRVRRDQKNKRSRLKFQFSLEGGVGDSGNSDAAVPLMKMLARLQQEANSGNLNLRVQERVVELSQLSYDINSKQYLCPDGSMLLNKTCVHCPVGTFFHVNTKKCQDCPVGTYQSQEGQNTCISCPQHKSTAKEHAKSETECKALCLPGTWSENGLEPCETCHIGFYQPNYSSQSCHQCRPGLSTHRRESQKEEDCKEICPPGFISATGLVPCYPCPHNSYQPEPGQTTCFLCPVEGTTQLTGSAKFEDCQISSELQADDWSTYNQGSVKKGGQQRQNNVPFNLCMTDPCENGGTCEPTRGFLYKCVCPRGFAGKNCENEIDFCAEQPCSNGGTCESYQDSYKCLCNEGFAGKKCEVNIDECKDNPCENNGLCVDGINSFTCNCPHPYTGKTCSTRIDHCSGTPCMNGGTCTSTTTGFKCACTADYAGESCEVDVDSCTPSPCRNGGTCQDLPTSYKCSCSPGFTGKNCEKDIDACAEQPCQNGARCEALLNSYKCHCPEGFSGQKCEKELDTNYQMDFATPTINDYAQFVIDKPLNDVTVAFWMKTTDEFNQGTPFSYAVKGVPNALTLTDYSNVQLFVNDETVSIGLKLNDGLWHHVALMWSSNKGDWKFYVDGVLRDQAYDLSPSKPIPGKGLFIIGQEQDVMGGQFSSSETFVGSLTQFNVWDGVLSLQEVHKLIYSCEKFEGNVLAWSSVKDAFKGDISISPSTFCKECPTPVNPLHGEVTFNDTKAGAIAVYACNRGYNLDRTEVPRCLSMGRYDQVTPICTVINCGSPGNIKFGTVKGRDYTVGKKVMFECNYGYKLSGINASVCTESGEWDFEEKPKCVPMTCTLPQVSENTIPSVQDEEVKQGTTVRFTCKPGNTLQTRHNSVVCQKDGTWDRSIPSCDSITCSNPPTIENGEIQTTYTQYNIGDKVRYQCNTGFEFRAGISSISCLPTGSWDTVLPVCVPITCPDPPLIPNAVSVGTDRTYFAVVNYTCLPGFKSSLPSAQIKCELTKDWSSTRFRCTEVDCGAPAEIPNGIINGDTYVFKNYVLYQCNQGYTLTGPERRVCQENGQWSDTDPVCSPVVCGNLTAVLNGQVVYTAMTYLSTARFTCDQGFEVRGAQEITCMASGRWVPDPPECVPRSCPTPQDILFGSFTSSVELIFKATVNYTCNTGYKLTGTDQLTCLEDGTWSSTPPECTKITCPQIDDPEHGSVSIVSNTFSGSAHFRCKTGYKLVGVDTRICQLDGTWSFESPTCQSTNCPKPEDLENGSTSYKDLSINSIVRYSCKTGYKLEGETVRRCLDTSVLSGNKPTCVPVDCGSPGTLNFGQVNVTSTIYNSVATFSCNEGYILRGQVSAKCQDSGSWSGQVPVCSPVECNSLSRTISNGRTIGTNFTFGSVIRYECNEAYRLEGSEFRRCLANGTWDHPIPSCEAVECPVFKLDHGYYTTSSRTFGTEVGYSCREGYRLEGPVKRTCGINGQWSGPDPHCLKILCTPPPSVLHSETVALNETALQYKCFTGYTLQGSAVRVCGKDQIWRPEAPTCNVITCPDLSGAAMDNGVVNYTRNHFGDHVKYWCDVGYKLVGSERRNCTLAGEWEGRAPQCQIIDCGNPGNLPDAEFIKDSYTYNSVIQIVCNEGFRLVGNSQITCLSDGTWSNTDAVCTKVTCPELEPTFPNGTVSVTTTEVKGRAYYTCTSGLQLVGEGVRQCLPSGEWSGSAPVCTQIFCPPPDKNEHAIIEGNSTEYGAKVFYNCEQGYEVEGEFSRTCGINGKWSYSAPLCVPTICSEPRYVDNGAYIGDSSYGSLITYVCDDGYELIGNTERFCQANGSFSGEDPECTRVSCGTPPVVAHAFIHQNTSFYYESNVIYSCSEGYTPSGDSNSSCLANRTWSSINFTCTIKSCPVFTTQDIPHGVFELVSATYGSSVTVSCEEGYQLSGESQLTCTSQAQWSSPYPSCLLIHCPAIGEIQNGLVEADATSYGSVARFSCNVGYTLVGAQQAQCQGQGSWSAALPRCEIVSCPSPPSVANGDVISLQTRYEYRDTATYACNQGYELKGASTLTCTESGAFDLPPPVCLRIACPDPQEIQFGKFALSNENLTLTYECSPGFDLIGSSILDCLLEGVWSGSAPSCVAVVCDAPTSVEYGNIEGSNYTFGQAIRYVCEAGYVLEGQAVRECQSDRSWSNEEPVCAPVSCNAPPEPFEHGNLTGGFEFGDGVEYTCLPGFKLQGEVFRPCLENGTWGGTVPTCIRLACPTPAPLIHGSFTGESYLFNDKITYTCDPGYTLVGESQHTCLSSQTWSHLPPVCERISCGAPPALKNGLVLGDSYLYTDVVTLTCNIGYRLVGINHRTCGAEGKWTGGQEWSDEDNLCEPVFCPSLPEVNHARLKQNSMDQYPVLSTVSYQCETGYIMKGLGDKVCLQSGQWSDELVSCDPVNCSSITSIQYGTVQGNNFTYLSEVSFTCDTGFRLTGSQTLTCEETGNWNTTLPVCKVVACQTLTVEDGSIEIRQRSSFATDNGSLEFVYGDTVAFTCNEGYEVLGAGLSQCNADGTWSVTNTKCVPVVCPTDTGITNAEVLYRPPTYGEIITVTCQAGYVVEGAPSMTCMADRTFQFDPSLRCAPVDCLQPPELLYGEVSAANTTLASRATYTCMEGFYMQGADSVVCAANGTWEGDVPRCIRLACPNPTPILNGSYTGESYLFNDTITYMCDPGYTLVGESQHTCLSSQTWSHLSPVCERISCGAPPALKNGLVLGDSYLYTDVVTLTCNIGYRLVGINHRTCGAGGNWSDELVSCDPVNCSSITSIQYGTVQGSNFTYLSEVSFTCDTGFRLTGSQTLTCEETGNWNTTLPVCKVVACPTLTVEDGSIEIRQRSSFATDNGSLEYVYGDTVAFTCNEGYEVLGEGLSQCNADGTWSVTNTKCVPVSCSIPTGIENAELSNTSTTYGSTITVTCIEGYGLIGNSKLTCGSDRNFVEAFPKCVLLACAVPPLVDNAYTEGDSFRQGDSITYRCKPGYDVVGNNVLTCGPSNEWMGTLPSCREVDCGPPPQLPNADVTADTTTFKSLALVTCRSGYVPKGDPGMSCSADRTWTVHPSFVCAPVDCLSPPEVLYSDVSAEETTLGSVAVYTCVRGYFMMGASSLVCEADGTWGQEHPKCSPMDCQLPPNIDNGKFQHNGTHYQDVAVYSCDVGYQLVNNSLLECGEAGAWVGEQPQCSIIVCGNPPSLPHATVSLVNNLTQYLATATYSCHAGYTSTVPTSTLTCSAAKLWEGERIDCQPVDCGDPPALTHGRYQKSGTKFGAEVFYSCEKGYVQTGQSSTTCTETGQWSESHACLPVDCQSPPAIQHGQPVFNSTTYEAKAIYMCAAGHTLVGDNVLECSDVGRWSAKPPKCNPVDCGIPPSIQFGDVTYTNTTLKNKAVYTCKPGYNMTGSNDLTCDESGHWVDAVPSCVIVHCALPAVGPNLNFTYTGLDYQSTILFTCDPGYTMTGQSSAICDQRGSWSSTPPQCWPKNCSLPGNFENGVITHSGISFGSTGTIICHNGYRLRGNSHIICNEEGMWNISESSCDIVDCNNPPEIQHGYVRANKTTYLSLASYTCSKGYRLVGIGVAVCQATGSWTFQDKPRCELVVCPTPRDLANGSVNYPALTVGSVATYQCLPGHNMSGTGSMVCGEDGRWQGQMPVCDTIVCPPAPDIPNGYYLNRNTHLNVDVEYFCSTGFIHEGVTTITCHENGTWSAELPVCKRISCAAPPAIAHSVVTSDTGRGINAKVTYSCIKGYRMVNDRDNEITITCGEDGDWYGKIPSCEIVVCYDPPAAVAFGTFVTTGDTYTSLARYTCNLGYTLTGASSVMCDHLGQWSTDDPPTCSPVSCGPPPVYELSSFEGSKFTYNQSVEYKCNPGFDLIGSSISTCGADRAWSKVVFDCKVKECSSLMEVPENGRIVSTEEGPFVVGDVVEFGCVGEFTLVGSARVRCAEDGQWDAQPPQCQNIIDLCAESIEMENIIPPPPGKLTGDVITIQCVKGYRADGDMNSLCTKDGNWTRPEGSCQRVSCGKPQVDNPHKVMLVGRDYFFGDSVSYICIHGFVPVRSPAVVTCLESGQWDGEAKCLAHCKQECLNGGWCMGSNRCKCLPGWAGPQCETANCILPCLHHGKCVAPYTCKCPAGYEGSRCHKVVCSKPCENGGRCLKPNRCQCPSGFSGAFCQNVLIASKRRVHQ